MRKLHDRVNLIPIIAKADTMTPEEIKLFKSNVLSVIAENKLQIYEFPDIDDDDADMNRTNTMLKVNGK
jgi:septin 7